MDSNNSAMYLRLKRQNQTYFVNTTKSKSILSIKEEISKAINNTIAPDKMRICIPEQDGQHTKLSDTALLSDHEKITNESILYIVFRKKGMEDAPGADEFGELDNVWEDVNIVEPEES